MRAVGGSPEELQVMYGLHGERSLTELELGWLPGYEDSRPVRIGNGAHGRRQLDVYGSVIVAFHAARKAGLADMDKVWPLERAIAKHLMVLWKEPDCSLWEVRGEPRHFVHSKIMCWLAFDRVIASATEYGLEGPVERWREVRDEIHAEVCARGYDAASNSFVQYYGADTVDAALLWMPLIGFLPIHDARVQGHHRAHREGADLQRAGVPLSHRERRGRPRRRGGALLRVQLLAVERVRGHGQAAQGASPVQALCWRWATTWACSPRSTTRWRSGSSAIFRRRFRISG